MNNFQRCRQAVVLVGGKGSRLGALTRDCPKPLMPVGTDTVFLDVLIDELLRQGFDDILLLAGYLGAQLEARYATRFQDRATVRVIVEEVPLGTGGALLNASDNLADTFLLLNGDTLFDFNFRALEQTLAASHDSMALVMALKWEVDCRRYGTVTLNQQTVTGFVEKDPSGAVPGLINAGAYFCDRKVLKAIPEGECSLENDVLPSLVKAGALGGQQGDGYFIDIGLPETLSAFRASYASTIARPALFLDRDGTINEDEGYTHRIEDLVFIEGAGEVIRHFCDLGWHVFLVTNQAGIAKGHFTEQDMHLFHEKLANECVHRFGASFHDIAFCPFHEDAVVSRYRETNHPDRKPNSGMLQGLSRKWPVDMARSLLVGDMPSDVAAAEGCGVKGYQFKGANLWSFMSEQKLLGKD